MKEVKLTATKRVPAKKGVARKLRSDEAIPAIVYDTKSGSTPVTLEKRGFENVYNKNFRHAIYAIDVEGETKLTLIKEIQKDKVSEQILHVDFFEFDKESKTTFVVPVSVTGEAPGVTLGGILALVKNEVKVRALPMDIPETIEVDVSNLLVNQSVRIRDIKNPAFEFIANPGDPLVSVLAPRGLTAEEMAAEEAEEAEAAGETPAAEAPAEPAA